MMRAVVSSLGLVLLFNTAVIHAQPSPVQLAEEEAVRRQEAIRLLRMRLADAQALQAQGRIVEAARVYEDAWALFPRIGLAGENVEADMAAVENGLVGIRLKLAEQAQRKGDLKEAETQIKSALRVKPQSPEALKMKLEVDKAIAASRGRVPSDEIVARIPEFQEEKVNAGTLVQDGKMLFEAGHVSEAEAKLRQALEIDPDNRGAAYYLQLIREQRFGRKVRDQELVSRDAMLEVKEAWAASVKRDKLPFPNPALQKDVVHTSPQRQVIAAKLNSIRLNEVGYDSLPLVEVLKHLSDESIKRDPNGEGLNFMINPHSEAPAPEPQLSMDPNAPPVIIEQVEPAMDISTVTVKLNPPLRNLRLVDLLDAIVTAADQPIRYEIRDYAIVFSSRSPEPTPLYTRAFKVDPNTFMQGLEAVGGLSLGGSIGQDSGGGGRGGGSQDDNDTRFYVPRVQLAPITGGGRGGGGGQGGNQSGTGLNFVTRTNTLRTVNDLVREYFTSTGVILDPPKSVFFNDRSGDLIVRATLQDLEIIELAVQRLNTPPPQVTIEAKFAEIGQNDSKALGFDWFLGNFLMGGGAIGAQGGSAPSYAGRSSAANPGGTFPGPGGGEGGVGPGTIPPSASDGVLTQGLRNVYGVNGAPVPELGTITGILTDPQFRVVIRALEQRSGADILSAPKVTTLSGRQAQISVLDLRTIVTGVENDSNTTSTPVTGSDSIIQNSQPFLDYNTDGIPFGPVLDVIPYVSADGYSIQMTLIPSLTEFLGYEDPGGFVPTAVTQQGQSVVGLLPLPRMRVRQVTTSCIVYDGQTVVLGGLISENLVKVKDKVPMLGDLPFLGRFFRSESQTSDKRNLVIFVTPTIIDPSGRRVHSDEDLPFARTTIPPQASLNP